MAKRYIRVNSGQGWENAPSVATPINKSNLNIMDKGIDDLDLYKIDTDAIANNLVTTEAGLVLDARQGKVLDDKVNTINNNLALQNLSGNVTVIMSGTIASVRAHRKSGIAYLTLRFVPTTPIGAGALVQYIAQLPNTMYPAFIGNLPLKCVANDGAKWINTIAYVSPDGKIRIDNYGTATLTEVIVSDCYVCVS